MLKQITITGADDSTDLNQLFTLANDYNDSEWGILFSAKRLGYVRYPSGRWIARLCEEAPATMNLSAHLQGSWLRDILSNGREFVSSFPQIARFKRVQLNFHADPHKINIDQAIKGLRTLGEKQFILQADGANDALFDELVRHVDIVKLYDTSGGAGVEPESWPVATNLYQGYAGGLHPNTLNTQLPKIAAAVGKRNYWIDVETHVRSNNDMTFDLVKVRKFLQVAYEMRNLGLA